MSTPEILPASPWCQRWRDRQHSWRHTSEGGFDSRRYSVELIAGEKADTIAEAFVTAHHYSGSYPSAKWRVGLYDAHELIGVAVFSNPTNVKTLRAPFPQLVPYRESTELGRFVLVDAAPANSESWFLSRCFELLVGFGVRGVVSMSDPVARHDDSGRLIFPGHVGTIYQATNAVYTGRAWSEPIELLPSGLVLSRRTQQKIRKQERGHAAAERDLVQLGAPSMNVDETPAEWLRRAKRSLGVRRIPHGGNHRYCFRLGRTPTQRRRVPIALSTFGYPKEVDAA